MRACCWPIQLECACVHAAAIVLRWFTPPSIVGDYCGAADVYGSINGTKSWSEEDCASTATAYLCKSAGVFHNSLTHANKQAHQRCYIIIIIITKGVQTGEAKPALI